MGRICVIGDRSGRIWPLVLRAVDESRKAGREVILYVPEQYTLQAERDLITGLDLPGLLHIRVISPRKLRERVKEREGSGTLPPLNEQGRAMAVYRVMTEKTSELVYYRNMTNLPGAVRRVGDALDELRESEMTREELAECAEEARTGAARAKLHDLDTIWSGYENLLLEHFADEKTVWTDVMTRLARCGMWAGADLLVYGFDTIRPDLRELLVSQYGLLNSASVFLVMDREEAPDGQIFTEQRRSVAKLIQALKAAGGSAELAWPGSRREGCEEALAALDRNLFARKKTVWDGETGKVLRLYAGASPWDEAQRIAMTLREWHREGIAWSAMAVARPAGAEFAGLLRANLKLNGIPYVWQEKDRASDHPVCRMLLSVLSCLGEGYRTDDVIAIARSGYSNLTEAEGIRLEDYARAHGIRDKRWERPLTAGADAADAEALRLRLREPMEKLRTGLKKARNAAGSAEALVAFLEEEGVRERLQEEEDALMERQMYREAFANRRIWQLLMDLLDQMQALLGKRRARIRDLKQMLFSALSAMGIEPLPEEETGVNIGEVGHMLAGETDALILSCAQDGMLAAPDSGWLSDPERCMLEEKTGKTIGQNREAGCRIRKYDFYRTLTLPRKRLMISWCLQGEDGGSMQPDGLVFQLKELFPKLREEGGLAAGYTRGKPMTPQAALDGMGSVFADVREGREDLVSPEWRHALLWLLHSDQYGGIMRQMLAEAMPEEKKKLEQATARQLFMTDRLSVSRLEQFAACPYRHFIDYGLRPVRREEFTFEDQDAGTFFHEALDRYMKQAGEDRDWPAFPPERVDAVMDEILADLTKEWEDSPLRADALGEWKGAEYLRRVHHAAQVLTRFAANSEFRTVETELSFGEGDGLPPLELPLRDGSTALIRGKIDRIDTYENGEGVWLRVIDNKSSDRKPDPARMDTGEQLQLMIYLKAAQDSMPGTRLAGALYFPVTDREVETPVDDPERIEADRISQNRMKGLVTAREDIVRAMDRDISPFSVDKVFKKDGTVLKSAPWAVDEETLRGLTEAAMEKAAELCERMRSGEIDASPYEDSAGSVCRFCDYRAICRRGGEKGRERNAAITFRDIAGKNTLRENKK